jgi:hypothetical protein
MKKLALLLLLGVVFFTGCINRKTVEYKGISFEFPEFLTLTYDAFDPFNGANIDITVSSTGVFMDHCVDLISERNPDLNQYTLAYEYTNTLEEIRNHGANSKTSLLESVSCGFGMSNLSSTYINVDDVNGVVFSKVSGNSGLPNMNDFFKQVLLVTNENQVYSIMFSYHFGELGEYIDTLEDENGYQGYLTQDEAYKWDEVYDYFTHGTIISDSKMKMFEENEAIVNKIINTITLGN